jgi:hypothetical protein
MSDGEDLSAKVEEAQRRLREATTAAATAEEDARRELQAIEAELEAQRQSSAEEMEELRRRHAEELQRERAAKEEAIAAAQTRLAEIEAQAESAAKRVEEAERLAAGSEGADPDSEARAREAAAAWLRGQIEAVRREAERR